MKIKILTYIMVFVMCIGVMPKRIFANSDILYVERETKTITDGLVYEYSERLYQSGWKDVHVLIADVQNPNIEIDILKSTTEHGLKKTVQQLVKENEAIAGINADFFGAGNPMSSMGQIIIDGKMEESQNYYNSSENKYAGFFVDNYGNVFIDYMKSNLRLYNGNGALLNVQAKNKITNFGSPVYFDRSVIQNTSDLDKRHADLYKIVVQNNKIIKKVTKQEVVEIPQNGYIIVMDKKTAGEKFALFNVGDSISFDESNNFVFREGKKVGEIASGISAGGEILRNGKHIATGMAISPNARNPRSAVGVNKEKNKIILIAVEGRGISIGATHYEMAQLLLEYGAYDAIHLDGGGSTTLAIRDDDSQEINVANDVSGGTLRAVPNAIGIKSTEPIGDITSLGVEIDYDGDILAGESYPLNIYGLDNNKNPIDVNDSDLMISINSDEGIISNNTFIVNQAGTYQINVHHTNGSSGSTTFSAEEPIMYLEPKATKVALSIGETSEISVIGKNRDGFSKGIDVSQITLSVDNADIGEIQNGLFVAKSEGLATVTVQYKNLSTSITIGVGSTKVPNLSFEQNRDMFMMYFPDDKTVTGGAGVTNAVAIDGINSLLLSYKFKENSKTPQASYVCFEREPILFNNNITSIQMQIKGDASNNIIKAVLKDRNNKQYILPVLSDLTSTDWVTANIIMPLDIVYPVRLDKLYVASLSTTSSENGVIYIDDISEITERTDGGQIINGYSDYLNQPIIDIENQVGIEDISVFGQTADRQNPNSNQVLKDTHMVMSKGARATVFVGATNLEEVDLGTSTAIQWNNEYYTTNTSNLSIINLATQSGNMRTESPNQWRWLQSYLENQSKNNILINMDKNIWDKNNGLTGARENVLFHKILKEFVQKTGKNVIVVSAVSGETSSSVREGVRYITLNGLTTNEPENLTNYKYLKIRASENSMNYEIKNVYTK